MTKKQRLRVFQSKNFTEVNKFYEQCNRDFFFNQLKCPKIKIMKTKRFLAALHFKIKGKKMIDCEIIFNDEFFLNSSSNKFKEAFIHEMCHQFCAEILNLPFEAHGNIWKMIYRSCNI